MKKKLIGLILATVLLVVTAACALVGCSGDGEKLTYSVTVLSVDEQPVKGVTVSWRQSGSTKGKAVTGDDGKASTNLPSGTYSIALSGMGEEFDYDPVSVVPANRDAITLTLKYKMVEYSATVLDKNGAAASSVTVTWMNGMSVAGTAVTDVNGAAKCDLPYGEYSVSVSNCPDGNIFNGDLPTVTATSPDAVFNLVEGNSSTYTVTVRSEGGLKFGDMYIYIYNEANNVLGAAQTNADGIASFPLPAGKYTAKINTTELQAGYSIVNQTASLTENVYQAEILLHSEVITTDPGNATYVIGDIIHNYTFTTPYNEDGEYIATAGGTPFTYSIAELLKTKKAVIINNWGTECSNCVYEMPAMEAVYQQYKDVVEFIAIDNYPSQYGFDSDQTIVNFRKTNALTFPMMRDDFKTHKFADRFGISGWPTTIVIDRYGAIARIEKGAITDEDIWDRLIARYVTDDYVQTFTPGATESSPIGSEISMPDITVSADHYEKVAEAVNKFTKTDDMYIDWYGLEGEYYWPYILTEDEEFDENETILMASNTGEDKVNSIAAIAARVKIPVGKVLTFDYYALTEQNNDVTTISLDYQTALEVSGNSKGWITCYLLAEIADNVEHVLLLYYVKDYSRSPEKDNVYFRNFRFVDIEDIDQPTDMLRSAAYGGGGTEDNDYKYTYYAGTVLDNDGYYRVDLTTLENYEYAGVDEQPMLFANLLEPTNWSSNSVQELLLAYNPNEPDQYLIDTTFTIDGVTKDYRAEINEYLWAATASDIYGYVPVDEFLRKLLTAFMKRAGETLDHHREDRENEWLDVCYFYSHYGDGEFIGNTLIGLTEKTAITAHVGSDNHADLTRNIAPFPIAIFSFTPDESGVYNIITLIPYEGQNTLSSQIWLYDDNTSSDDPLVYCGDDYMTRDGENEYNASVYQYLTANHKYYIAVAFQMGAQGTLDFKIELADKNSVTILTKCAPGYFVQEIDENGNWTGAIYLETIGFDLDDDGYYHAINDQGEDCGYIYLDVKYASEISSISIEQLVTRNVQDPTDARKDALDDDGEPFGWFDFRHRLAYTSDDDGVYWGVLDLTSWNDELDEPLYLDYTEIIKGYIAQAEDGLVKVDRQLMVILSLFIETRVNMMMNGEYDNVLMNEWLRFCWYNKTYDINHG